MRILNISAQKPEGTGSGTFLSQTVAAQVRAGHHQRKGELPALPQFLTNRPQQPVFRPGAGDNSDLFFRPAAHSSIISSSAKVRFAR